MRPPITIHLPEVEDGVEAIQQGEAVKELTESYGWRVLSEGIERQFDLLTDQLVDKAGARETAVEYEAIVGEMRGLRKVTQIIDGIRRRAAEEARKQ